MEFTAKTIAEYVQGTVSGDPEAKVWQVAPIENAPSGALSFLANPKYAKYIHSTQATIVLVNKGFETNQNLRPTLILVDDAYKAFASLLDLYQGMLPQKTGIESKASISNSAAVGEDCYIGDFAYIGENATIGNGVKIYPHVYVGDNVTVDDNTILYPGVKIYAGCAIGKNCILHAGTVIGSDGFGFAPTDSGFKKIPQIGNVIIEDDVELGANTTIDRATMGATLIRKGTKLDNLIQIAHNVEVGEHTVMAAQTGISGSSKIGSHCMIGGQVGIAGHITIADRVQVGAQSGLGGNVKENGAVLWGSPAFEFKKATRAAVAYKSLPEMMKRLNRLEKALGKLTGEE